MREREREGEREMREGCGERGREGERERGRGRERKREKVRESESGYKREVVIERIENVVAYLSLLLLYSQTAVPDLSNAAADFCPNRVIRRFCGGLTVLPALLVLFLLL